MATDVTVISAATMARKRLLPWPQKSNDYQWKGTISETKITTKILAHCLPKQQDVIVEIKNMEMMWDMDDIDAYFRRIQQTVLLSSEHVLSPVTYFQSKTEIWIVYPLFVGGPLSHLLASHYVNGMTDEDVVATILYDVAEGLHAMHCADLVHCNIRPRNLHMCKSSGTTLLSNLLPLKSSKYKKQRKQSVLSNISSNDSENCNVNHKKSKTPSSPLTPALVVSEQQLPYTDPALLHPSFTGSFTRGDIYSFGILAMELCFGYTPPTLSHPVTHAVSGSLPLAALQAQHSDNHGSRRSSLSVSLSDYPKPCSFSKEFQDLVTRCVAPLEERITLKQILEHHWFTERRDQYAAVIQCVQHIPSSESVLKHSTKSMATTHSSYIRNITGIASPGPLKASVTATTDGVTDSGPNSVEPQTPQNSPKRPNHQNIPSLAVKPQILSKPSVTYLFGDHHHEANGVMNGMNGTKERNKSTTNTMAPKEDKESSWDFTTDVDEELYFESNERPLILEDIEYGDDGDRKGLDGLDSARMRLQHFRDLDLYGHREASVPQSTISKMSIAPSMVSTISKLSPPFNAVNNPSNIRPITRGVSFQGVSFDLPPHHHQIHHGHHASKSQDLPNIIKLNVGGKLFTTKRSTLQKYDTMLSRKFSGDFDAEYDEESDSYFIDRSGKHFEHILNYLRTGKLIIPAPFSQNPRFDDLFYRELFEEAQYFQIGTLIDILNPENVYLYSKILQSDRQVAMLKQWVADPTSRENSIVPMSTPSASRASGNGLNSSSRLTSPSSPQEVEANGLGHEDAVDVDDIKEIGAQSSTSTGTPLHPDHIAMNGIDESSPLRTEQNQRWRLIYRASDDGFEAHQFHRHCDLQGATVTLIHANNRVFGGYTDIPWRSDSSDKHCATKEECFNTFIFSMKMVHSATDELNASKWGFREDRYHSCGGNLPVAHERNIGPAFGWYHVSLKRNNQKINANMSSRTFQRDRNAKDKNHHHHHAAVSAAAATISQDGIVIGDKCDVQNNSSWTYCAYFDTPKDSKDLAGTKYFFVKDIEVYQVAFG